MPPENEAQAADSQAEQKPKGKLKPLIIVAALMIGEGVGLFAVMKMFSAPPAPVIAAEDQAALEDPLKLAGVDEVQVCEVDAFNRKEGRLYAYHLQLTALVKTEDLENLKKFVEVRGASIADRVQEVIRAAEPQDLNDPSLEAIKRQLKFELNNLLGGREMIQDVLIPKLLQSRTNL